MGRQKFDTCPIKFEKGNWYFINFLDPSIIGIYVYIDEAGNLKQYTTYSGVSPIQISSTQPIQRHCAFVGV